MIRSSVVCVLVVVIASVLVLATDQPFDIVITNGHIIDGTGSPWYSGDVGIRDGHISEIGNLSEAPRKRTIDARGQVVAPGFIDMLGQSEVTILVDPSVPSKIYQGITTEVTGEGGSAGRSTMPSFKTIVPLMRITRSLPTGAPSDNTLRGLRSRESGSISPAMSARPKCGGWFWVMPMCSRTPLNSIR